ncbi:MAG: sensor histidine kinase [Gammaproteobacteria bacterium]
MRAPASWLRAFAALFELRPRHAVPLAARLAAASLLAVALALGLMGLVALIGHVDYPNWWWASLLPNIGICLCIVHTLFGVLHLARRVLPAALIDRMAEARDIRSGMLLCALALAGILLGTAIGFTVVPYLVGFKVAGMFVSLPVALTKFALFMLLLLAVNWAGWRARLRQQALRRDALDARLRLLQGQIEPHLLFNTLANIHSLMDYDPPRAKRMLETFSTYLRAGLSQLREGDSTVAAELEMAHSYLALMQIRMEERLRFRVEASEAARAAAIPPLMLQPLVENAIHHGLDPKLDGGEIVITADLQGDRLAISVLDDGMGLDAPARARPGAGMALANLRARLAARYGDAASLRLQARAVGTEATLELPWRAGATQA